MSHQPNLSQFFPGLGGTLPPAVRHALDTGAGGDASVHRFDVNPVFNLDPSAAKGELKITDVSKLANAKPSHPAGAPIVASGDIIAYGLKAGNVRVIHTASASKAVLKGHNQAIVDMAIRDTIIATCADDGLCLLWDITVPNQVTNGEGALNGTETMRLRSPAGNGIQRIQFHPKDQDLIFVAHGPSLSGVRLDHALWVAYTSLPNKEVGLGVDTVAAFRTPGGAHSQTITDFAFSDDGNFVATVGTDGVLNVFACDFANAGGELRLAQRRELGKPLSFVAFAGWSVVCGTTNIEELILISAQGIEASRVRFGSALPGVAVRLRAQNLPGMRCFVLCDQNMPISIVVRANETGIRAAYAFKTSLPILSFCATQTADDAFMLGAVTEQYIQLAELDRISYLLPPVPSTPTPQPLPSPTQQPVQSRVNPTLVNPAPARNNAVPASTPGMSPPPVLPFPIVQSSNVNSSSGTIPLGDLERLLDEKLGALGSRLEAQAKERAEKEEKRLKKLLEQMSVTLGALREAIQADLLTQLTSPAFIESLATAVKAGVGATDSSKSVEKAIKSMMPMAVNQSFDTVMNRMELNLNKALDEAFRARLVPAFEAGCRDLISQMDEAVTPLRQGERGTGGAAKAKPSKRQVDDALAHKDYISALNLAIELGDQSVITSTCTRAPLIQLLKEESLPQPLLVALLSALAQGITNEPVKRLEWIRELAVHLDQDNAEIADVLPSVAQQAKAAIEANSDKLGGQIKPSIIEQTKRLLDPF